MSSSVAVECSQLTPSFAGVVNSATPVPLSSKCLPRPQRGWPTDITDGRSHDTWTHAQISPCSENGKERLDGYAKLYFVNPKCQNNWNWQKGSGFDCRVGLIGGGKPKGWNRKDITHRLITSNWNCCRPSDSVCNANGKKKECDESKTSFNYDPKK